MYTVNKEFHFATTTEGWTSAEGDAQIQMAWYPPHKNRGRVNANASQHQTYPLLSDMGGCIRTTTKRNAPSTNNYWHWVGSWTDLGVPAGKVVNYIIADYLWRVDFKGVKNSRNSAASYGVDELQSGPFELRDNGGSLIDTFSVAESAPARSVGARDVTITGSDFPGLHTVRGAYNSKPYYVLDGETDDIDNYCLRFEPSGDGWEYYNGGKRQYLERDTLYHDFPQEVTSWASDMPTEPTSVTVAGTNYVVYPVGDPDATISYTPSGWAQVSGSSISVPAPSQPSASNIELRLNNSIQLQWMTVQCGLDLNRIMYY